MFPDGTFICWLASNLSGRPLVGANRKPLVDAAARANWLKAIDVLRDLPRMSRRCVCVCARACVCGSQ